MESKLSSMQQKSAENSNKSEIQKIKQEPEVNFVLILSRPLDVEYIKEEDLSQSENDEKHMCDNCGAKFETIRSIKVHIGQKYCFLQKSIKCERCNQMFITNQKLNRHLTTNVCKKTFECDLCPKSNCKKNALKIHIESVHIVDKTLCKICGKKFRNKRTALMHEKTLHGENILQKLIGSIVKRFKFFS
jgi:hypothetical protein